MEKSGTATLSLSIQRTVYLSVLLSLAVTAVAVPYRALTDPIYAADTEYRLIALQAALGVAALHLPRLLESRLGWRIPAVLSISYMLFLWAAVFLGEAMGFYYRFSHWDDLLHLTASIMLGIFGLSLTLMLSESPSTEVKLSPIFIAAFSVTFALSVGALWEIYEYACDGLLGINMQKHAVRSSLSGEALTPLVGRAALRDTMEDLMVDLFGASLTASVGYICMKRKSRLLGLLLITQTARSHSRDK